MLPFHKKCWVFIIRNTGVTDTWLPVFQQYHKKEKLDALMYITGVTHNNPIHKWLTRQHWHYVSDPQFDALSNRPSIDLSLTKSDLSQFSFRVELRNKSFAEIRDPWFPCLLTATACCLLLPRLAITTYWNQTWYFDAGCALCKRRQARA